MIACLLFAAFCFNLPEIADRNLEYDTKEDPFIGTRPNGTVATFTCMDGFILDGITNTRICLNGVWTGTERVLKRYSPQSARLHVCNYMHDCRISARGLIFADFVS